uniref:Apolipoprotein L n=1 Tax=Haplochromis burtoni TaxID=8153 RepID=A0A3Q2VVT3_HAPBU
ISQHADNIVLSYRKELQTALCRYITDTLTYIHTVTGFCEGFSKWLLWTETELDTLMDIKDGIDALDLKITHVYNSEEKCTAFLKFMKNKVSADSRREKLEKELTEVLEYVLRGQEKLQPFLDAVEKLAVTSLQVFGENQELHLPEGIRLEHIQSVISAAQQICPLLLEFKRDSKVFFLPKLENVDVLAYQLDRYIVTSQKIHEKTHKKCNCFFHSAINDIWLKSTKAVVDLNVDSSEAGIQSMLHHIYLLEEIRMNPDFRMVFMFMEKAGEDFISKFEEHQPRMLKFLDELEQCAVQLDKMSKGSKISSVAGSSAGVIGGVLSIVGLALIPVTAGASLALTMTGVGLGITSGLNSAVTTGAEMKVNHKHQTKAGEVFKNFMEDVQSLQDCLQKVTDQRVCGIETSKVEMAVGVSRIASKVWTVGKGTFDLVTDATSAAKVFPSAGKVLAQEGKALRNASRLASDIPDIGEAALKGSLALSKTSRGGFIALNALFLGMDIFFIYRDGTSLAKGCEAKVSQVIRARAALWSSEIDSWQKICDSLKKGLRKSEKNKGILESPFYPETTRMQEEKVKKTCC